MKPPFHADHVGSLLRPPGLAEARKRNDQRFVDEAIRNAVRRQEAVGLQSVTDDEFRRDYWHLDFMKELDGLTLKPVVGMTFQAQDVPPLAAAAAQVKCSKPIMLSDFAFLKRVTRQTSKCSMHA